MKINKKRIGGAFILIIFCIMIYPRLNFIIVPSNQSDPSLSGWETGDGTLSMYNESISEGDDLQETIYYNFTADLINTTNCSIEYDAGFLETEFKDGTWHTSDYDNITVGDLINYNDYIPGFDDFYDIVGNLSGWVDLSLEEANDALFSTFYSTEVEHYPGTFSFTNDTVGGDPANFSVDEAGGGIEVSESIGHHRNVVDIFDNLAGFDCELIQFFLVNHTYGILEFWMRADDVTDDCYFSLWDSGTEILRFAIRDDDFDYYDGAWHQVQDPCVDDTWYHIKILFECSTSGLEGLDQYDWRVFIDEVEYGDYNFINNQPQADWANWSTTKLDATYNYYVDAIGYSWNTTYLLGDNYHWNYYPGTYDFEEYNITLDGNYYSINITGENDDVGDDPSEWTITNEAAGDINVVSNLGGHNKIIEMDDGMAIASLSMENYFHSGQSYGTIELYGRTDSLAAGDPWLFNVYEGGTSLLKVWMDAGVNSFQAFDGAGTATLVACAIDTWYHIRVDFECGTGKYMNLTADTYAVYIDDVQYGAYDFQNVGDEGEFIRFGTGAASICNSYIDAMGYSWNSTEYCSNETTHNYARDFESWNMNPYDIPKLFTDDWYYYGTLGSAYSIDGEFGIHKKYLQIDEDSNTEFFRAMESFEDEVVGTTSTDIEFIDWDDSDPNTGFNIVAEYTTHRKVLQLDDQNGGAGMNGRGTSHFDNAIGCGSIEFWVATSDTTQVFEIAFYDAGMANPICRIQIDTLQFQAYHTGAWNNLFGAVNDQWYHVRIDFRTGDAYMGLADNTWLLTVDGTEYGPWGTQTNDVDMAEIYLRTGGVDTGYAGYIDAISVYNQEDGTGGYNTQSITSENYIMGDNIPIIGAQIWNNFTEQTWGNISFWINGDFNRYFRIYLMNDNDFITSIKIEDNVLYYLDNRTWTLGCGIDNDWHYIKLFFNATSDTYDLWVDKLNYTYCDPGFTFTLNSTDSDIEFQQTTTGINKIMFETRGEYTTTYMIDAVQYCWDDDCNEYWDCGTNRWDLTIDADTFIAINDTVAGYTNTLNMTDWGAGGLNPEIDRAFENSTDGWIEFDVYINSTYWGGTDCFIMELHGDTFTEFSLQFYVGYIRTFWVSTGETFNTDEWIKIRVVWNLTDYWLYINDSFIETGSLGYGVDINNVHFEMMYCDDGDEVYLDNIVSSFWYECYNYNLIPNIYAILDFKIALDLSDVSYLCYRLYWAFLTTSDELVNFSWYNFDIDQWDEIIRDYFEDSDGTPGPWTEYYNYTYFNSSALDPYINSSGDMLFRFKIVDFEEEFEFYLDELRLHLVDYVKPNIQKAFDWRGIWRYRWFLSNGTVWTWTNWTYFEVIPLYGCANFEGISESQYTTYWELIGADVTPVERFHDDITGVSWYLSGVAEENMTITRIPTDDAEVDELNPMTNYGSETTATASWLFFFPFWVEQSIYIKYEVPYLTNNCSDASYLRAWFTIFDQADIKAYNTTDFDEDIITWDNKPVATGLISTTASGIVNEYKIIDLGDVHDYYFLNVSAHDDEVRMFTSEYDLYPPSITHTISKKYHGGGYVYMQTNITESLTLRRTPYGTNTTLSSGDYFELDIQSSASDILMKLYSGGVLNTTLTVLSGSTDSSRRTVGVGIPADITFDQIEFVGTNMEDTEYFKCYDIFVGGYDDVELYYDMFIDPDGQDYLMAQVGDYVLRIWDEVDVVDDVIISRVFIEERNITLTYELFTHNYIPIIEWNLKIYHYAYELSIIEIFNATDSALILNTTAGHNEILDINLANGTYVVNWTNGETGNITSYNITMNIDRSLILDTTYFSVYFGLFTNDGLGINRDAVRFYVNSVRKDLGDVWLEQDSNELLVLDYFNQTLYSATVNLRDYTEWNIYVEIFTLNLFNNYTHVIDVEIERNNIEIKCTIPPQMSFEYRFVPNVHYEITWYYENGTEIGDMDFEFEENGQIVSFGFFETEVPYDPEPLVFDFTLFIAFIIFICVFGWIIVILYARWKAKANEVPKSTRERYKKKWKPGTFRDDGMI